MEHLFVVVVAALAGYLTYRLAASLGRRLAGDEVLQVPPQGDRTADGAGLGEDLRAPEPSPASVGEARPQPRSHRWRRRRGAQELTSDAFAHGAAPPLRIPARTRLLGLLGLVALIVLAAALIAVALYQAGHLIRLQFESYLG